MAMGFWAATATTTGVAFMLIVLLRAQWATIGDLWHAGWKSRAIIIIVVIIVAGVLFNLWQLLQIIPRP